MLVLVLVLVLVLALALVLAPSALAPWATQINENARLHIFLNCRGLVLSIYSTAAAVWSSSTRTTSCASLSAWRGVIMAESCARLPRALRSSATARTCTAEHACSLGSPGRWGGHWDCSSLGICSLRSVFKQPNQQCDC